MTHGFFTPIGADGKPKDKLESIIDFIRDSTANYAQTALAFVSDAHRLVQTLANSMKHPKTSDSKPPNAFVEGTLRQLSELDELYETMTLNHVTRRASRSQGVALLSLYSKGFTKPAPLRGSSDGDLGPLHTKSPPNVSSFEDDMSAFVDRLKLTVRREETHGHLPICWGVLTAALGLSLGATSCILYFLCSSRLVVPLCPTLTKYRTQL